MLIYGLFLNIIFCFFNYQPVVNSDHNLSVKVVKEKTHKISHAPKVINKVYQYIYHAPRVISISKQNNL